MKAETSKKDDHAALEQLREQARAVGYELRALGQAGIHAAEDELQLAKKRGQEFVTQAKDQTDVWEKRLVTRVQEEPVKMLAYAAGVGLLLGLYLRR